MSKVCVYCCSSLPKKQEFVVAAHELAQALLKAKHTLIYGGAHIGLMGILAQDMLEGGGEVWGVFPEQLSNREVSRMDLSRVILTSSMAERKQCMNREADAFICLPGGLGTMDELFDCLCLSSIGVHQKPCGLLNVGGYYDKLLEFLDGAVECGTMDPQFRRMLLVADKAQTLLEQFPAYTPPALPDWCQDNLGKY